MSFSFEFQIFFAAPPHSVQCAVSEREGLSSGKEEGRRGTLGRATGVRVRLIEHSTETPFESGNDRVREPNDGDDGVDDDGKLS